MTPGTFHVLFAAASICMQITVLLSLVHWSGARAPQLLYTRFNPVCWFALFYGVWFISPQVVSLLPSHLLIGFEDYGSAERLAYILGAQGYLCLFLLCVGLGVGMSVPLLPTVTPARSHLRPGEVLSSRGMAYVLTCLAIGVAAMFILGREHLNSEGMRSELVKTPRGKLLTTFMFFGNFAFAFVFSRMIVKRKFLVAACILLVFATGVFFTGARGRLLWPLALSTAYLSIYYNNLPIKRLAMVGTAGLLVLLFADPLLISARTGSSERIVAALNLQDTVLELFQKRNFDGFSNFAMISQMDQAEHSLFVLYTGARDRFMGTYFAEIYASGVGFGSTIPGMLWIAGGMPILIAGGIVFGISLGLINVGLRQVSDERLLWAYLFGMTWFCAIGGNFQESADKLVAAASPPLIWWLMSKLRRLDFTLRWERAGVHRRLQSRHG